MNKNERHAELDAIDISPSEPPSPPSVQYQAAVMAASTRKGAIVQHFVDACWTIAQPPLWQWNYRTYRIKPGSIVGTVGWFNNIPVDTTLDHNGTALWVKKGLNTYEMSWGVGVHTTRSAAWLALHYAESDVWRVCAPPLTKLVPAATSAPVTAPDETIQKPLHDRIKELEYALASCAHERNKAKEKAEEYKYLLDIYFVELGVDFKGVTEAVRIIERFAQAFDQNQLHTRKKLGAT